MAALVYPVATIVAIVATDTESADRTATDVVVFAAAAMLLVASGSAAAFRARVVVDDQFVTITNTFVSRTVPVSRVASVESQGLDRLRLVLDDGSAIKCWAIQATNAMLIAGRETRVDKVAVELRESLAGIAAGGPISTGARRPESPTGISWHACALIVLYIGLVANWFAR